MFYSALRKVSGCVRSKQNACLRLLVLPFGAVVIMAAAPNQAAPSRADCDAALRAARIAVNTLPSGSPSRRFAEFDLVQAKAEENNTEFDDCVDYAAKATDEARHPHHQLSPSTK